MVLDTSEGPTAFRGTVASFIGDNLGSQLVGGFMEGSSALHPCRVCVATSEDIQQKIYVTMWPDLSYRFHNNYVIF